MGSNYSDLNAGLATLQLAMEAQDRSFRAALGCRRTCEYCDRPYPVTILDRCEGCGAPLKVGSPSSSAATQTNLRIHLNGSLAGRLDDARAWRRFMEKVNTPLGKRRQRP